MHMLRSPSHHKHGQNKNSDLEGNPGGKLDGGALYHCIELMIGMIRMVRYIQQFLGDVQV